MILPSKWEGMPIVIYEAIENGVIPIISDQIKVPSFLRKFVLTIDISNFNRSIKLINRLNSTYPKKYSVLIRDAINVCQKNLNGSKYKVILNI